MKEKFNKVIATIINASALTIILGLFLIIFPDISLKVVGFIFSLYLIIQGIIFLSIELKLSKIFIPYEGILLSILTIILGLILLNKPNYLSILITIVVGIWIIITSINTIKTALFFRNIKNFPSYVIILLSTIDIILGLLLILNPFEASISITIFIGIILIAHSILTITDMIVLKKNIKEKENKLKEIISKFIPKIN